MKKNGITKFYSAGTRFQQPLFSDLDCNFYITMDLIGNPFFTGTQPTGASSKYDYNRTAISVGKYFVDNLFGAYDYYRVAKIETTFTWASTPSKVVNGELYTAIDKDSREAENSNAYINRSNMQKRLFNNHSLSHTVSYTPHMVDFISDDDSEAVQYVQPTDRWWNTSEFRNHRWGCLRYVVVANALESGAPDQCIFVRHRVWLEVKGQKDVITPSVPPARAEFGKQNRSGVEVVKF